MTEFEPLYLKMTLASVGLKVDSNTASLIIRATEAIKEKGGQLTLSEINSLKTHKAS